MPGRHSHQGHTQRSQAGARKHPPVHCVLVARGVGLQLAASLCLNGLGHLLRVLQLIRTVLLRLKAEQGTRNNHYRYAAIKIQFKSSTHLGLGEVNQGINLLGVEVERGQGTQAGHDSVPAGLGIKLQEANLADSPVGAG